jgi:peptide/nickel transport system substrate-binding protein
LSVLAAILPPAVLPPAILPPAILPSAASAQQATTTNFNPPRDETLYTSGTSLYPPTNFNPLDTAGYTGSQGLLYEPLFLFDPVRTQLIPWLAAAGSWATPTSYRIQVRGGVDWVSSKDGAVMGAMSGRDVAYSVNLAVADKADPYHADVASAKGATVSANIVTVTFQKPVGYAQWQEFLWHAPVLPAAVWSRLPSGGQSSAANTAPVSTGPMLLNDFDATKACYRDNPHWWGTAQLHLSFKFAYLCDTVSGSSGSGLSNLLDDRVDWSNQLLRGIPKLADGYGIKTYYSSQPYMLAASTAWLQMDVARAPMDNVDFRRAVAYALDPASVVATVYTGTVEAANPTGLLPELAPFVDKTVVRKYGFYFSPSLAQHYLVKSGYKGQQLVLTVPEGWTDLIDAAKVMCQQLGKVGIHVVARPVPIGGRNADVASGNYDMVINYGAGLSQTPWSYFDSVYQLPLAKVQAGGLNTERFSAPSDWSLVQEAAATPLTDTTALDGIYANLELDFLQDLPEIPLWYSGAWFQANTGHWDNYPTSTSHDDEYTPVMWPGWLGSTTTVYALAQLDPARKSH